jgi:hypothetical protein
MGLHGYAGLYYHLVYAGKYVSSVDAAGGIVLSERCEGPLAADSISLHIAYVGVSVGLVAASGFVNTVIGQVRISLFNGLFVQFVRFCSESDQSFLINIHTQRVETGD